MPETAPRPAPDPLAVRCCACLAPPGDPCIGTTSNLPRERPHRLRPLAAAPRLIHCPDCEGSGWRETGRVVRWHSGATCPVCGAPQDVMCTEGGAEREALHEVRRRAARAGLEECPSCEAVGWVPEPAAPRPDVPDEAVKVVADLLFAVYEAEYQADHLSWEDFAGQARILIAAASPPITRQVRERVAAEQVGWTDETTDRNLRILRMPCGHARLAFAHWPPQIPHRRFCLACDREVGEGIEIARGES